MESGFRFNPSREKPLYGPKRFLRSWPRKIIKGRRYSLGFAFKEMTSCIFHRWRQYQPQLRLNLRSDLILTKKGGTVKGYDKSNSNFNCAPNFCSNACI